MPADPRPPISADPCAWWRRQVDAVARLSLRGSDERAVATVRRLLRGAGGPAGPDVAALQARALTLAAQSLVRLGRYDEAMNAYGRAPRLLAGPGHAEAQAHVLAGAGFAYAHRAKPELAARMASGALRVAFAHGFDTLASHALDCLGVCHAMRGELCLAEQLMLEALGIALQSGDEPTVQRRLSNLMFLAQLIADERGARGDAAGAADALARCGRFVAQGNRLAARAGVYERCLWRSNRAGWLRRRGRLDEARAEYEAVDAEGAAHGWVTLVANVRLELALVLHALGRGADALRVLVWVTAPIAGAGRPDIYDTRLHAHALSAELAAAGGREARAEAHRAEHDALALQRERERIAASRVLAGVGEAVAEALAQADRTRLAADVDTMRRGSGERASRYLAAADDTPAGA